MPSRPLNILIVAAHPADSFDQAGGTLAHHVERGDNVTAVVTTTGVRSHHWELAEKKRHMGADFDVEAAVRQATEEKLEEVRAACRIMGFDDVRDLGFEDDDILVTQEKIEAIADVIREVKPDILISHHPFESGGLKMHGSIGQCTMYAWQLAQGTGRGRQERHPVPVLYFMNPTAYVGNNSLEYAGTSRTDLYVDITDVIEKKVKALDRISSQFYGGPYSRKRSETSDGAYGQSAYVAYAESFQRFLPQVLYYLPITEHEMEAREQGPKAGMGRRGEIVGGLTAARTAPEHTPASSFLRRSSTPPHPTRSEQVGRHGQTGLGGLMPLPPRWTAPTTGSPRRSTRPRHRPGDRGRATLGGRASAEADGVQVRVLQDESQLLYLGR